MIRTGSGALLAACAAFALAAGAGQERAGAPDQTFVTKAVQGGLAEVNLGTIASKQATDADVVKFAKQMVTDHTKANKELLKLANQKRYTVPRTMDEEHEKMRKKLLKMTGSEFDRAYMEGQVKDHKDTIALFEKEAKDGKDEDLRKWAKDTLPTLREHLKMAEKLHDRLGGGKGAAKPGDR